MLDQELAKATKVIEKSKKISEVQVMVEILSILYSIKKARNVIDEEFLCSSD